ncbi:MAG: RIP metalloprotease RseP [Deltaproteobacteria bacterium]
MIFKPEFLYTLFWLLKALVALSVLIVVHEWGHFIAARRSGVKVEVFSIGFGKVLFSRKRNGTEFAVSAVPLGGYVKLAGDTAEEYKGKPEEFLAKKAATRAKIIVFGPLMNYVLGFLFLSFVFFLGFPKLATKVGDVKPAMGAASAGIRAGDVITDVDGKKVETWDNLQTMIRGATGKDKLQIGLQRGGQRVELSVPLMQGIGQDELMQKKTVPQIGIIPDVDERKIVKLGFFRSFWEGARETLRITGLTYKGLWYMIIRRMPASESVTGPVGIFDLFKHARSLAEFLLLSAIISISLALFNILPIPILDGGHLFFLALEKVRGKPISKKTEDLILRIALSLLIAVAVLVTLNDLRRLGVGRKIAERFKGHPQNQTVPQQNQTVPQENK